MNKTKIEWCDYTWNPVTGCLHNCEYCYARKIANRFKGWTDSDGDNHTDTILETKIAELNEPLQKAAENKLGKWPKAPYPFGFKPTLHKYRLDEPTKVTKPQKIFVCSMADLFGDWVPDEWIQEVFKACEAAPQHKYLFLTKNYDRYEHIINSGLITVHDNYWFGTTVTTTDGGAYRRGQGINTFASIEPILERFNGCKSELLPSWVIIGAETGNRKGKVIPEKEWIDNIVSGCHEAGAPVFMKNSLKDLMGDDFIQEWPEGLR